MATDSFRKPSNGGPMPSAYATNNGASRASSHRRRSSHTTGPPVGHYGNENGFDFTGVQVDQHKISDPSSIPDIQHSPPVSTSATPAEAANKELTNSNEQQEPLSRSNTVHSSSDPQNSWASDRSPLQKLEVALTGISKEEKRARVMEAERRLRERMERQNAAASVQASGKVARENPKGSAPGVAPRALPEFQAKPPESSIQDTKQSESGKEGEQRGPNSRGERVPENTQADRTRAPSISGRPLGESLYAGNKPPTTSMVKTGSAPRRSVSVSHPPAGARAAPQPTNQSTAQSRRMVPSQKPTTVEPKRTSVTNQSVPHPTGQPQGIPASKDGIDIKNTTAAITAAANLKTGRDLRASDDSIMPEPTEIATNSQSKPRRHTVSFNVPPPTPPPLAEWKNAPVAKLELSDFDFQDLDVEKSKAWWEGGGSRNRRQSRALPTDYQKPPAQRLTTHKRFQPLVFLKCGPLLRYTGLKRVRIDGPNGSFMKETWRGSILIVTKDSVSSYEPRPTLRLFSQPMNLLPPPPAEVNSEGVQLAPEYIDPTAGLMKLGRDGRPLYVKPVDHTEEELDLSFVENDDGIYEMSASMIDYTSEGTKQPIPANRIHQADGETSGTYKEITGFRLYADPGRDVTFWKFNIEIDLGQKQQRVAYRLNQGPALGFWVPARGQSMNIMFHTCNGFSPGVDSNKFCGPDPLWRDVLNEHQTRPFHVMIGGGDQIFNDKVTAESFHFQEWLKIKDLHERYDAPLDPEFKAELETSFLENYSMWFSQGLFSLANSQIPMINMWNDHEILEGFGSYPDEFMNTPVISGLGNIAFKYYMLFQHHSVPEETEVDEPSWILGAEPGPYINQRSRNIFMSLGDGVALLGLDCRTERMSDEIISERTCELIWDRCHHELVKGETKHLIVLLSIPIAYPRVAVVKNILNSRQTLGKAGLFGGFVNKHGGKVEIYDDHWTAKHHKSERTFLIEDLQDLAADKSIRVTILSGDVHLAAVGQFYSNPTLNIPKDKDYRYMPNIIASGIADMPTTEMISDTLNRRNHVHHMDTNTDEDMIPIFTHDVNNKPRNNKRLLPRRNWCSIREYKPGSTPPGTPETEIPPTPEEPRPNMLQRTLSLTRGDKPPGGLLRRLSLKGKPPTREFNLRGANSGRRMSMSGPLPPANATDSYFPDEPADFRPGPFLRRPTNLSQKAAKKAAKLGDDGVGAFINLEEGLAVTLNLELNPKDPSGITTPYKLLIPALRYDGAEYDPPAAPVTKGWKKWFGMRENKSAKDSVDDQDPEDGLSDDDEDDHHENHRFDDARGDHGAEAEPLYDEDESDLELEPEHAASGSKESQKRKKWFGRL